MKIENKFITYERIIILIFLIIILVISFLLYKQKIKNNELLKNIDKLNIEIQNTQNKLNIIIRQHELNLQLNNDQFHQEEITEKEKIIKNLRNICKERNERINLLLEKIPKEEKALLLLEWTKQNENFN